MTTTFSTNLKAVNPANLEVLAEVPVTSKDALGEAFIRSQHAFVNWSNLPLAERLERIAKFGQLLMEHKAEIAKLITLQTGKPITESYIAELSGTLDTCTWLSKNAQNILANENIELSNPLMFGKRHYLHFEPLGVVGVISPWNYPFSIPVMTMLMALAAGNTVILKPSEKTPLVGLKIGELFSQAGFPENVVTIITGAGETGAQMAALKFARLIFTGSVNTGMKIINASAPNITPLTLELGGKDAAIVLPDAPLERTARALVWGAFTNAGQACASIERVYLVRGSNTEALITKIVEFANQLKAADPMRETTEIGPLIDVQQFDHVVQQVQQAVLAGAKVLCGGEKLTALEAGMREQGLRGYYYRPTVLTDVNHSMDIMREETFGPILPIMVVDSTDEAIALANDSVYGLTASVWSANIQQAQKIANKLLVGTVFINDCLYSHVVTQLPWGGLKKSGFGRSHSDFGLLDLVNVKHISVDSLPWMPRLWWYPYHASKLKATISGLEFLYAKTIDRKLSSLWGFLTNMFKTK